MTHLFDALRSGEDAEEYLDNWIGLLARSTLYPENSDLVLKLTALITALNAELEKCNDDVKS